MDFPRSRKFQTTLNLNVQYPGYQLVVLTFTSAQNSLSTWESKVRVDLRIRKKNKANHWPLVYRHLAPRLERPGKKRLRKPTTIRLDGREIPFDEAWKEIRRSGAHKISPHLCK